MDVAEINLEVQRRYGAFAETGGHTHGRGSAYAVDHGLYRDDELALVPPAALDLSRGCDNPTGLAGLELGGGGRRAGFAEIEFLARHPLTGEELDAMARCPGPEFAPPVASDDVAAVGGKVLSLKFTAIKP